MFSWLDYAVFSATIALSLAIGLYYACSGGRQRTTSEYLMADRSLQMLPVSLSMSVSYTSSIAVLGNSSELHYYGIAYVFFTLGLVFGIILAAVTAVPLFYPLQVTSMNEYLTLRYESRTVLVLGWLWQTSHQAIWCGLVLYGPAVMFEAMVGFPSWATVLLMWLICTVYTTLGGLKGVIWTDVFQSFVIFGAFFIILGRGIALCGGFSKVFSTYNDGSRLSVSVDPSPLARQSVWTMVVAGIFSAWCATATSQTGVQRICALKSLRDAKVALYLTMLIRPALEYPCSLCGVVTFAYYASRGCDPLRAGYIESPNQILPYFVSDVLDYWGMPGLLVACVFAAGFSTVSSCFNGIAAMTWDDLLSGRLQHWTEFRKTILAKLLTIACGIVSLGISMMTLTLGGTIMQVTMVLSSISICPLFVIFVGGALVPRINWMSVSCGAILSMGLTVWISIGSLLYESHQVALPTTALNCTQEEIHHVITHWLNTTSTEDKLLSDRGPTYVIDDVTTRSPDADHDSLGLAIYRISPYLVAPLTAAIGTLASVLLSFLPGCSETGRAKRHLYYPCTRSLLCMSPDQPDDYKMVNIKPESI